jgi:hypothetical protein
MASINEAVRDAKLAEFKKRGTDAMDAAVYEHNMMYDEAAGDPYAVGATPWACYWLKTEFVAEGIALCALAAAGLGVAGIAAGIGTGVVAVANLCGYTLTVEEFATAFANDVGANVSSNPYNAAGQLANVICIACGGSPPCNQDGSA